MNIVMSIVTSVITSGAVGIVLKLWLSHKFKKLEQEKVAKLTEEYRVKAKVFDERYEAYKKLGGTRGT